MFHFVFHIGKKAFDGFCIFFKAFARLSDDKFSADAVKKAYSVIYLTSIELFDTFAKYEFNRDPEVKAEDMYEHILNCDLLIIDDLGTEMNNSFTNSKLFYCINERIVNKKSTIISTNLSFQELIERYSERIFSRLTSSYTMLKMYGDDIRIKKKTV